VVDDVVEGQKHSNVVRHNDRHTRHGGAEWAGVARAATEAEDGRMGPGLLLIALAPRIGWTSFARTATWPRLPQPAAGARARRRRRRRGAAAAARRGHMHPLHTTARHPKVSESQNGARTSGWDISKPFGQPIKTRETGARPVLVYCTILWVHVGAAAAACAAKRSPSSPKG
jgi:hypothetical protein